MGSHNILTGKKAGPRQQLGEPGPIGNLLDGMSGAVSRGEDVSMQAGQVATPHVPPPSNPNMKSRVMPLIQITVAAAVLYYLVTK